MKSQIENPEFDSQTKENLTLVQSEHGSKPILSSKFIRQVEQSGMTEAIENSMMFKEMQVAKRLGGKKSKKVDVKKLDDAIRAGTSEAMKCTLIITEGDSAKSSALAGVSSVQGATKYFGIYPLRGKMLNVRDLSVNDIKKNAEITAIIQAMGFNFSKKYDQPGDIETLRYGKMMIMTDQDVDGSHIKGLVINFIHKYWPALIQSSFIEQFITPIVRVYPKKDANKPIISKQNFYSLPEFDTWHRNQNNPEQYIVDYYKGLGTSTSEEFKEYFADLARHRISFDYTGDMCSDAVSMVFTKARIAERKVWLSEFMMDAEQRKQENRDALTIYNETQIKTMSYSDFINKEFILFSHADLTRSIASTVDGLKPGQRKVMWTCFKRNDQQKIKVAQLAGSVAELSAYHHGEAALVGTIVKMGQNYVGSNNINILQPLGQFGSRIFGGKDHAAARYIYTKLRYRHILFSWSLG